MLSEDEKLKKAYRMLMPEHRRRQTGIAGQAFTEYNCFRCEKSDMHPNTAVPIFCEKCEEEIIKEYQSETKE